MIIADVSTSISRLSTRIDDIDIRRHAAAAPGRHIDISHQHGHDNGAPPLPLRVADFSTSCLRRWLIISRDAAEEATVVTLFCGFVFTPPPRPAATKMSPSQPPSALAAACYHWFGYCRLYRRCFLFFSEEFFSCFEIPATRYH